MKKTDPRNAPARRETIESRNKRGIVYSLLGKFKGKGLLEELMTEKARERKL